jgi:hypothetical protein
MGGLWFLSVSLFTSVLVVVTIDLMIFTRYHTWINFVILLVITFIAYIIFVICAHHALMFKSVGTMSVAFGSPRLWMGLIFVCGTCALIDYFILGFDFIFRPTLGKILQRLYSQRGELNDERNLPKCICDRINKYKTFEQQKFEQENEKDKIPQNTQMQDYMFPHDSEYLPVTELKKNIEKPPININIIDKNNNLPLKNIQDLNYGADINPINQQFINETTNSNMNININNTNNNLFNNSGRDDLDIFPNYPRPSTGNSNNNSGNFVVRSIYD